MKKITLIAILNLVIFANNTYSQDGSLDTTFDGDGKVITYTNSNQPGWQKVALQSDGKIVVANSVNDGSSSDDFGLFRYNTDGSLDTTFDLDGMLTTSISAGNDYVRCIAIQSDGKIVVAGASLNSSNIYIVVVVRYNPNGSLDTTFDSDGIFTTTYGENSTISSADAIDIQSDGKIVLAGSNYISFPKSKQDFLLIRLNTDGSLDTTLDNDGKLITSIGTETDEAKSVQIQSDGKIVVGGRSSNSSIGKFALVRYNSNGSLDNTFDTDGIVTTVLADNNFMTDMDLQTDDKIIVLGLIINNSVQTTALVRYNINGSLDYTFDIDEIQTNSIAKDATSFIIQPNGKIIVAGRGSNVLIPISVLLKYNTDGSLDTTFDMDGIATTQLFPVSLFSTGIREDLVIQSDGKLVLASYFGGSFNSYILLARFNNTLSLSVPLINAEPKIQVFPNPVSDFVTIQSENDLLKEATLTLSNAIGQIILKKEYLNATSINIDMTSQPNGIYFLTLENQGAKTTQKIIKN